MTLRFVGSSIALLSLVACLGDTPVSAPSAGDLDGKWGWDGNGNPGGSSVNIRLATAGSRITGSGEICGVGPNCAPGSVSITGDHGPFHFAVTGPHGFRVTYSGEFVSPDRLQGSWTQGGKTYTVTLVRCGPTTLCW